MYAVWVNSNILVISPAMTPCRRDWQMELIFKQTFSIFIRHNQYHARDVTLSVYPNRTSLKNMPDHGGNRTYHLWDTSSMLFQLSYAVWSVQ